MRAGNGSCGMAHELGHTLLLTAGVFKGLFWLYIILWFHILMEYYFELLIFIFLIRVFL